MEKERRHGPKHDHGTKYGRGGSVSKIKARQNAIERAQGKKKTFEQNQNLESNAFRFKINDDDDEETQLILATIDAATRVNSIQQFKHSNIFSPEEVQRISKIIGQLDNEDQANPSFLIPVAPLQKQIKAEMKKHEIESKKPETENINICPKKELKSSPKEDLDAWLDDLLS